MSSPASAVIACTLSADDLGARLERVAELGRKHVIGEVRRGRQLQLHYAPAARSEVQEIVRLESQCCAFLQFEIDEQPQAIYLTITAPAESGDAAGFLFEHFTGKAGGSPPVSTWQPNCGCARA